MSTEYEYQGKHHGGGCTGKAGFIALILFLIWAAAANAQTKTDSIRKSIEAELRPKIAEELQKEIPYLFECYFKSKRGSAPMFVINGYVKANEPYDSKHKPLDKRIVIIRAYPVGEGKR